MGHLEIYLDAAYIAKIYLNDPDSHAVERLVQSADVRHSSTWAIAEVNCAFHRHLREGLMTQEQCLENSDMFADHTSAGFWNFHAITESLLKRTGNFVIKASPNVFLRAGDALHLTTAENLGLREIWTNDRHMIRAAPHFGLTGRSVHA